MLTRRIVFYVKLVELFSLVSLPSSFDSLCNRKKINSHEHACFKVNLCCMQFHCLILISLDYERDWSFVHNCNLHHCTKDALTNMDTILEFEGISNQTNKRFCNIWWCRTFS